MIQRGTAQAIAPVRTRAGTHEVVKMAQQRLQESPYLALRSVDCEFYQGVLTLTGEVPTYYTKQMAQTLVRGLDQVQRIENRLFVNY